MSPPDTASSSSATDQNRISQAGSIECTSDKSDEIALGQQTVGLGIIEANNPKLDLPSNAKNGEPQLEHTHGVASEGRRSVPEKAASLSIDTALSSKTTMDTTSGQPKDGSTDPPPPPPKDEKYSKSPKPTPQTPELDPEKEALKREDAELEEGAINPNEPQEGVAVDDSRSEIQSIMEQFDEGMGGPGADEIMSPRLEIAGPLLGSPIAGHPPRKSSLEPLSSGSQTSLHRESSSSQPPPRSSSLTGGSIAGLGIIQAPSTSKELPDSPSSPKSQRQHPPLPPRPDPEPDLPFDFHRFLEQLRHRTADPVAKFLRSFLLEFGKKQWMVHEQVKIISDFLEFIAKKMAICEVWRTVSDAEFDNACEGMEKLVMNRLYSQTFSPAIPPPDPLLGKGKRRTGQVAPGRRGQHQEDVERDEILAQKVRIYSWVRGEHLDIKTLNEKGQRFLVLAQQGRFLILVCHYR
jgi:Rab5 GDP/GTP exchange factor